MAEQRLADMLEEHPDAKAELRALVEEIQEALPAGTVSAADHARRHPEVVNVGGRAHLSSALPI